MRRIYDYLFVRKDPALMAWRYRRPVGIALMCVGAAQASIGLAILLGVVR